MSCTHWKNLSRAGCQNREKSSATRRFLKVSTALLVFLAVATAVSFAQATFTSLYSFADGTDGSQPYFVYLVQGTDGQLYGTDLGGGLGGLGVAYKITTAGVFTKLYTFCSLPGCADGGLPYSGLVMAPNGNFYGTTTCDNGCTEAPFDGTIFELSSSGTYTGPLHTFVGTDGSGPYSNMILASDGNLYGTTIYGGNLSICGGLGCGTVFKITTAGKFTSLYSFSGGSDGQNPTGRLFQGINGNLYGTTTYAGNGGYGTVFEITLAGKLTTLYSFANSTDGANPYGGIVQTSNGVIYGTAAYGGSHTLGTIFRLAGTKLTTVYNFCSVQPNCADGNYPYGGLIQANDGNLYGTTLGSGPNVGGTVFEFIPSGSSGTLNTLYSFCSQPQCTDGANPYGGGLLQATDGNFYGTTSSGGGDFSFGTIFSISNGLSPFVQPVTSSGKVGVLITILGTNLTGATSVTFNGTPATFQVRSSSEITAHVPAGATTGKIQIVTPGGTLSSNTNFKITPQITSFNPLSGPVGTVVTITGVSLTQTSKVTFGGVAATSFTVNSDTQVTATVPTGAKTGKIVITTPGGTATSPTIFTVTP